jgi:formamidopyrimidine-DNA glycosylase
MADEVLWQAGLSPTRAAGGLSGEELAHLRRELRKSIRRSIRLGGVHNGEVIPFRKRGAACPRCGTPMERATVAGRTTFWCPEDQV